MPKYPLLFLTLLLCLCALQPAFTQNTSPDSPPKLIPYRKGELWGFAAPHTKAIVIAPRYHEVTFFEDGVAQVRLNKNWGLIDQKGKEITKLEYTKISPFHKGLAIVQVGERIEETKPPGEKYGAINRSGKEVIPVKYTALLPNGNFFTAGVGYNEPLYFRRNRVWHMEPKEYVLLNRQGKVLSKPYTNIDQLSEGMAKVNLGDKWGVNRYGFSEQLEHGLWGYIDSTGREVVPVNLYVAEDFSDGRALIFRADPSTKFGFITPDGKDATSFQYEGGHSFSQGVAPVVKNRKWGAINKEEKTVIDFFYTKMNPFDKNGLSYAEMIEVPLRPGESTYEKRGVINRKGEVIVPFRHWYIKDFKANGFAEVTMGENKIGRASIDGKVLLEPVYKAITDTESGFLVYHQDGKIAFLSKEGKELVPPGKYEYVGELKSNRAYVSKGGKYGYINGQGKEVIPLQFFVSEHDQYGRNATFSEDMAQFCQSGRCGYIDSTGKIAIPLKYRSGGDFKGNWAHVTLTDKTDPPTKALVNKQGTEVILPDKHFPSDETAGLLRITNHQQKSGFMNAEGKMVIPVSYTLDYYNPASSNFTNGLIQVLYTNEEDRALATRLHPARSQNHYRIKGYLDINGVEYYED